MNYHKFKFLKILIFFTFVLIPSGIMFEIFFKPVIYLLFYKNHYFHIFKISMFKMQNV